MKKVIVNKRYKKMLKNSIKGLDKACAEKEEVIAAKAMRDVQSIACRCEAKSTIKANKRDRIVSCAFKKFNCTFNKELNQ